MRKRSAQRDFITCPKCGSNNVQCVLTVPVLNDPDFNVARRRHCKKCRHRWYSAQKPEQLCHVQYLTHLDGTQSVSVVPLTS